MSVWDWLSWWGGLVTGILYALGLVLVILRGLFHP